jgi:hypothetical protein
VTFFVASDTHFGFNAEVERRDLEAIRQMNTMEGAPWPEPLGGTIGKPCGVLVAGDLTEDGKSIFIAQDRRSTRGTRSPSSR